MKKFAADLRLPFLVSFLLVIPLMAMEYINRRGFGEEFPVALFVTLWMLPLLFMLLLMPLVKNIRSGNKINVTPRLFARASLLIFIAWFCIMILIDQMPCFLGVPNCD